METKAAEEAEYQAPALRGQTPPVVAAGLRRWNRNSPFPVMSIWITLGKIRSQLCACSRFDLTQRMLPNRNASFRNHHIDATCLRHRYATMGNSRTHRR